MPALRARPHELDNLRAVGGHRTFEGFLERSRQEIPEEWHRSVIRHVEHVGGDDSPHAGILVGTHDSVDMLFGQRGKQVHVVDRRRRAGAQHLGAPEQGARIDLPRCQTGRFGGSADRPDVQHAEIERDRVEPAAVVGVV